MKTFSGWAGCCRTASTAPGWTRKSSGALHTSTHRHRCVCVCWRQTSLTHISSLSVNRCLSSNGSSVNDTVLLLPGECNKKFKHIHTGTSNLRKLAKMLPTQRISCMRLLVTCTHESYISVFKSSSLQMQQSQWHKPVCILRLAQFNVQWPGCENDEWNRSLDLVIQFVTSQWVASFLTPSLPDDVYIYVVGHLFPVCHAWRIYSSYTHWFYTNLGTAGSAIDAGILAPQDVSLVVGYFFGLLLCASLQCYIETGQCVT